MNEMKKLLKKKYFKMVLMKFNKMNCEINKMNIKYNHGN